MLVYFILLSSLFTGSAGPQAGAIVAVVEVVVLVVVLVEILFFFVPSNVILLTRSIGSNLRIRM